MIYNAREEKNSTVAIKNFLAQKRPTTFPAGKAISLFSGAGISDTGYALAGFDFVVQVEMNTHRAKMGEANFFPEARPWIIGDVRRNLRRIIATYRARAGGERPALLVGTPPCQGLSSSNPSRGQRKQNQAKENEDKNKLLLTLTDVARALEPRVIVVENVRQVRTLHVDHQGYSGRLVEHFKQQLPQYEVFESTIEVADYGIPQTRKRAILVAVHRDESWLPYLLEKQLSPWPSPTHSDPQTKGPGLLPWITSVEWFQAMAYPPLDSQRKELARDASHPLHEVPSYEDDPDRYLQISSIPPYQGRSAYQNATCPHCQADMPDKDHDGRKKPFNAHCPECGGELHNRPYVREKLKDGTTKFRLIKGFASSYRRMHPLRPCSTVTTNTSHIGSDYKIHPYEHRVLSTLEANDLQTVPHYYNWDYAFKNDLRYTIRTVIGEAFPAYFTYLHGQLLANLLNGQMPTENAFSRSGKRVVVETLNCYALVPVREALQASAAD